MLSDLIFRIRSLFRPRAVEAELDDELRFHSERQLEKYLHSGMLRDEALRRVRMEFGGFDQVKEECRDARGVSWVETLLHDIRYALRTLRKSPGFTAVALFTLALGIGANTAIFSVVYGVLLRPLPYRNASSLVVLNETTPKVGKVSVSYANFLDWRAQSHAFSEMSVVHSQAFNLAGITQPENISGQLVSPNFLSMTGVHLALGRGFAASDDRAGTAPVLLLSYPLWQSHFGGDPNAIGRSITLDSTSFAIIGVLPPEFRWAEQTDVVAPIGVWLTNKSDALDRGERGDMLVVGRLAAHTSLSQARSEMVGIAARLAQAYPGPNDQFGVELEPFRDIFTGDVRPAILVLLGAAVFVLLVACANVANLFLMRGAGGSKEMALRIAIGASRGRIVCQILAESFVVALLGGVAGVALATGGIAAIRPVIAMDTMGATINLNGPVLLFSAALVILSMFVFGLAPALHSTGGNVQSELKEGGKTTSAAGHNRWRGFLATSEVALALILLVGAGLMVRSLYRLLSVDPGIQPERVLRMAMSLRTAQYSKDEAIINFWQQTLDRVREIPAVEAVALGTGIPLTDSHSRSDITIEGMPLPKPGSFPHPDVHIVSPAYASTLGIQLVRGRTFQDTDRDNAPGVTMVNNALARQLFPNDNPVGKRLMFGRPGPRRVPKWLTIVGVLADTKMYGLANPARMEVYLPFRQIVSSHMDLVVKSGSDPAALTSAIRAVVASIDKDQPIFAVVTMKQLVADSVSTRRVTLVLLGLFGGLALVLAGIGIYGVIAYSVAQRTREIGIRVALGAQRRDVLRLILIQGGKIAGVGIVAGTLASLALTRLMANLLYSVSAVDPPTFAAVALGLALIAMLACYIPARRTLRVDPLVALRHE